MKNNEERLYQIIETGELVYFVDRGMYGVESQVSNIRILDPFGRWSIYEYPWAAYGDRDKNNVLRRAVTWYRHDPQLVSIYALRFICRH